MDIDKAYEITREILGIVVNTNPNYPDRPQFLVNIVNDVTDDVNDRFRINVYAYNHVNADGWSTFAMVMQPFVDDGAWWTPTGEGFAQVRE